MFLPRFLAPFLFLLAPMAQAGSGLQATMDPPEPGWREAILRVDQRLPLDPDGRYFLDFGGKFWKAEREIEWGVLDPNLPEELSIGLVPRSESPVGVTVDLGQKLLYRLPSGVWGLVTVLYTGEGWVRVEQLVLGPEETLRTTPALKLAGSSEPDGYQLTWNGPVGSTFRLERWTVGQPEAAEALSDPSDGDLLDRGAPRSTLLEYSLRANEGSLCPASRIRLLRQDQPTDWPIALETGLALDLLTGSVGSADPDLEVHQLVGSQVFLRASENCPLSLGGRADAYESWEAPPFGGRTYMPHIRSIEIGSSAFFYLSKWGLYGRIALEQDSQGRVYLRRTIDLEGGRWMPLPPKFEQWECDQAGIHLYFQALSSNEVKNLSVLDRIVELERVPGSGVWEELDVGAGAQVEQLVRVEPMRPDLPLVSLRFRHRYGEHSLSIPSDPVAVLVLESTDSDGARRVQQAALDALSSDEYVERFLGEHVLLGLGSKAWPALLERYSEGQGIASDLARQILLSPEGILSGQLEFVMERAAQKARLAGPAPSAWFQANPKQRIYAMLLDSGGEDRLPWLDLVKRLDPDVRVRQMAGLLLASPVPMSPMQTGGVTGIFGRMPAIDRPLPFWPDWWLELDRASPRDAAAAIRRSIDGERFHEAQALLALARQTEYREVGFDPHRPFERVILGLGLVGLQREKRQSQLLRAVREGVVAPGANLAAWRDLMDWRLGSDDGAPNVEREVIRLESASMALLQETLTDLVTQRRSYVDVILPSGNYHALAGLESWLDVSVPGLALIGEGEVELMVGLRAADVPDLVLVNLAVDHRNGSALSLTGATVTLRGVTLRGSQTPIAMQDAVLELEACQVQPGDGKDSLVAVRLLGSCLVLGRGSMFDAGGWVLGDRGEVYLDHCVIDGGSRPVFQGQRGGYLVLRDCALVGGSASFQGLQTVWLEGVLQGLPNQGLGPQNETVYQCPVHQWSQAPAQPGSEVLTLDRCPLSPER